MTRLERTSRRKERSRNQLTLLALGALTLPFGTRVTLAVVLLGGVLGALRWGRYQRSLRYNVNVISVVGLMATASLLALVVHGDLPSFTSDAGRIALILGIVHLGIGHTSADTRRMMKVLAWSTLVVAVLGAIEVGSIALFSLAYKTELQGALPPNELGGLAAMAILGLLVPRATRRADVRHMLPAAVALLLSASRTAAGLLVLVAVGAIVMERLPRTPAGLWRAVRPTMFAGLGVSVLALYSTLADAASVGGGAALRGRPAIWQAARETVTASFPLGLGSEEAAELAKRSSVQIDYLADAAGRFHSVYLDLVVQYGVLGIVLCGWAVYALGIRLGPVGLRRDRAAFIVVVVFGGLRAVFESGGWLLSSEVSLASAICWALIGSIGIRSTLDVVHRGGGGGPRELPPRGASTLDEASR